jgi:hypothetical protein
MTFRNFKITYANYPLEELRKAWISNGNKDPYLASRLVRLSILAMALSSGVAAYLLWLRFDQPDSDFYQQNLAGRLDIYIPILFTVWAAAGITWMIFRIHCLRFVKSFETARGLLKSYQMYLPKIDIYVYANWNECAQIAIKKALERLAYLNAIGDLKADDLRHEPDITEAQTAFRKFGCLE